MPRSPPRQQELALRAILAAIASAVAVAVVATRRPAPEPLPPALVLVCLDGFRWDYARRTATPALDRMSAEGVHAESLIPPFPAKTFPSHYTLVTGLHPAHHGIVSNGFYDPVLDATFDYRNRAESRLPRWWGGEPIWITARRHGLRSAAFFWPGSEVEGRQPDEWRPYDGRVSFAERVDQVLEWLSVPEPRRFRFVALYVQEPNDTGHEFGPTTAQTDAAAREADAAVGRLLDGLERGGLKDRVDVVVVSDHGMAAVDSTRVVPVARYADLSEARVTEMRGIFLARGPSFRVGYESPAFSAVDVYELLCAPLGIAPAPNDGDPAVVAPLLRPRGALAQGPRLWDTDVLMSNATAMPRETRATATLRGSSTVAPSIAPTRLD